MSYQEVKSKIPENVTLVVVSKTRSKWEILRLYEQGQRIFGENKVQELCKKYQELPKDIQWHFIGHLQTNKVKMIAPFVDLIHAVDSLRLLEEINKHAKKHNRIINCLLQFHIAQEESKYGFLEQEFTQLAQEIDFQNLKNICVRGVMGMATNTDDEQQIRQEFANLRNVFNELKTRFFDSSSFFDTISMGMSQDFTIAIEQGSTMVRVGSAIFN